MKRVMNVSDAARYRTSIWEEEDRHLDRWEQHLAQSEQIALDDLRRSESDVRVGRFDDHDSFIFHSEHFQRMRQFAIASEMRESLQNRPYYGRVDITPTHEEGALHFFLSDDPNLDAVRNPQDSSLYLVPFRRDGTRPLCEKIIDSYTLKDPSVIRYQRTPQPGEPSQTDEYQVLVIREVAIEAGQLMDVKPYYPQEPDLLEPIDADEMLARRLEKDRGDGKLRNIIATIQHQQFELIRKDPGASFVLQGCAGSGKTQIMIHRLFYLRGQMGQSGWEDVVILTPSHLFNAYTADLMAQYKLTQTVQLPVAAYYRYLLTHYDKRFNARQYAFQMTEEYLPEAYLQRAYAPETIEKVMEAMRRAIQDRLAEGSKLTRIPLPERHHIRETISAMLAYLTDRIRLYDEEEKAQGDNAQMTHMKAIETLQRDTDTLQRARQRASKSLSEIQERAQIVQTRETALIKAKEEANAWTRRCESEMIRARRLFDSAYRRLEKEPSQTPLLPRLIAYMDSEFALSLLTSSDSPVKQQRSEISAFYREAIDLYEKDLTEALEGVPLPRWNRRVEAREQALSERIRVLDERIQANIAQMREHEVWLEQYARAQGREDTEQSSASRSSLERVRYRLERIESSIFEQEVWNALSVLKDAHGIPTTRTLEVNGRHQTTRILYKIDLMFYLRIYYALYGADHLPKCQLLCIDEGQDLHAADYQLLRELYPGVPINVFGDIAQALHANCGVQDWQTDVGIDDVTHMDCNYRNPQEIVEFCMRRFGGFMRSVGIRGGKVTTLSFKDASAIRKALLSNDRLCVIVRDRQSFELLSAKLGDDTQRLRYLDMASQHAEPDALQVYSVFAAKGLEFRDVMVVSRGMSVNQKLVACTRATQNLIFVEEE